MYTTWVHTYHSFYKFCDLMLEILATLPLFNPRLKSTFSLCRRPWSWLGDYLQAPCHTLPSTCQLFHCLLWREENGESRQCSCRGWDGRQYWKQQHWCWPGVLVVVEVVMGCPVVTVYLEMSTASTSPSLTREPHMSSVWGTLRWSSKGEDRWGLRGLKPPPSPQNSDKTNSVVWERQK